MTWTPQNYIDKVGPTILSSWLNSIDVFWGSFFGAPASQSVLIQTIAAWFNPKTAAETAAAVSIANFIYPAGNILRYGCDPTGVADCSSILITATNIGIFLYAPPGRYLFNSNVTFTVPVSFAFAAVFAPAVGVVLNFNRGVLADAWQIFDTTTTSSANLLTGTAPIIISGTKVGVHVAWFNAKGDASTDDFPSIQAAINCVGESGIFSGVPLHFGENKAYALHTGLVAKQGRSSTDTHGYLPWFEGHGATLLPATNILALFISPRCLLADAGTGRGQAPVIIRDFIISGGNATAGVAAGLQIGAQGFVWYAKAWSLVQNLWFVGINDTGSNKVLMLWEGGHCHISDIALPGGATCFIQAVAASSFCGDITFSNCEFAGNGTQLPVVMSAQGTSAQVRGIKFQTCDFYGGYVYAHCTGSSAEVGDLWFTDCQFDQQGGALFFLQLYANGAATLVDGVHVNHCYFVNGVQAIQVAADGGGVTDQIDIAGCQIGTMSILTAQNASAINCVGANGVAVHDCQFDAITGGAATSYITFQNCTHISATNNNADNSTSVVNGVTVFGTSNFYSFYGNNMLVTGNVVNDGVGGTPTQQKILNLAPVSITGPYGALTADANLLTTLANLGVVANGGTSVAQLTGWGTPTGNAAVSNFPGATATLLQTSTALAQVIATLKALGYYGA